MRSRRPLLASTVAALLLVSCAPTETVSTTADVAGSTPVVLDGDFGPDDMMALFYLLQRPDLDVLAVTVSGTGLVHCPQGAANAAAILSHLGRADIPVACGPDEPTAGGNAFPEEWRAGSDELATSLGVEPYIGHVDTDAVGLLTETIGGAGQPVRLLVLGPMTNIALALDASPDLVDDIADITTMAGAFDSLITDEEFLQAYEKLLGFKPLFLDRAQAQQLADSVVTLLEKDPEAVEIIKQLGKEVS